MYPAYSSLRSDPLGAKALFDAFANLDSVGVQKNYNPVDQLKKLEESCLIFLGVNAGKAHYITKKEHEQIMGLLESGCRLVIALTPANLKSFDKPSKNKKPRQDQEKQDRLKVKKIDLFEKLNITMQYHKTRKNNLFAYPFGQQKTDVFFTPVLWPLALWFQTDSKDWNTIFHIDDKPVVIEKKYGKGSLVLLADSYIFSNESLKKDKNSPLFAWLVKDRSRIVFDEFHFGIQKRPGISTLIKKYNLYGPVMLFAIFILLFIWKNSSGLVPPNEQNEITDLIGTNQEQGQELEKDNISGLANLLKQNIARSNLINECKKAWKDSFVLPNEASQKYLKLYEEMEATGRNSKMKSGVVDEYIRICNILSKGKNQ
ncbi:MAG: hypothetical protein GY729_13620 [Desulfobacteraceae bacterium]|nr:hypothetical protein [Desulfobacteraceae bacterium]